ncbi:hypothetical protein [Alicyclobacillus sp. SP_1]|jgi:hypothetical protein|uniref:hypothetical protein n=1 Tax=Alicyclobacillus sp. SP_1 TaxID=2942475 RepID=UPI002157579B|nr:hypothetical protein [Alicyclobacillus sp. SP_1]
MQKRIWGLTASALALTCLTVTGCGTDGGVSSGSAPATHIKHSATTNATHSSHTNAVTSESVNNTSTSKNQTNNTTTTGNNKTQSQSHSQSSYSTSGMVHLNLTNAQIQTIRTAINKLRGNPNQMTFADGDVKIYVPLQVPQGQQFLKADFGASALFGAYVSLYFNGFKVRIGGQQPSLLAIHKTNSVKLSNGATGTWYAPNSRSTGTNKLSDYFMTWIGKTHITISSNLKSVSQAQIEQMAGSMVFLGAHQ